MSQSTKRRVLVEQAKLEAGQDSIFCGSLETAEGAAWATVDADGNANFDGDGCLTIGARLGMMGLVAGVDTLTDLDTTHGTTDGGGFFVPPPENPPPAPLIAISDKTMSEIQVIVAVEAGATDKVVTMVKVQVSENDATFQIGNIIQSLDVLADDLLPALCTDTLVEAESCFYLSVSGLKLNQQYYVRVAQFDGANTGPNSVAYAVKTQDLISVSDFELSVLMGVLSVLLVVTLVLFVPLKKLWNTSVIFSSQPLFLLIMMLGIVAGCVSLSFQAFEFWNQGNCTWIPFIFLNVAFDLIFSPLFLKTWRSYKILGEKRLIRVQITNADLIKMISQVLVFDLLLVVLWLAIIQPGASTLIVLYLL